jgi:hypothetical protein
MPNMPDKLFAYGNTETRDLHFWHGTDVLISDDKDKLVCTINNVYGAGEERAVVEASPEEMHRLIVRQWGEGIRYSGMGEAPAHPTVRLELSHVPDPEKNHLASYLTHP